MLKHRRKPDLLFVVALVACAGVVISTTAYGADDGPPIHSQTASADGFTLVGARDTGVKLGYSAGVSEADARYADAVDHYSGRAGYGNEPEAEPRVYFSMGTRF